MEDSFSKQIETQQEAVVEETRQWVRAWEPDQREMVLWILEEEVRDDNLLLSTKKKLSLPKVKTTPSNPSKNLGALGDGGDWKALQSEEGEDDV